MRSWPGVPQRAHLVVRDASCLVRTPGLVADWVERLRALGYKHVRTNALPSASAAAFRAQHFGDIQRLLVLSSDLEPRSPDRRPRSTCATTQATCLIWRPRRLAWRRSDELLDAVSRVDRAAFGEDWWLDRAGVLDAYHSTPTAHLVVHAVGGRALGYGLAGCAGTQGFIQRLAVEPSAQGQGVGRSLLECCLRWLHVSGAQRALLNTHHDNAVALALYRRAGFEPLDGELTVLERTLEEPR